MKPTPIRIAGRTIGAGGPPLVVAELSANHRGRFEQAVALVAAAADAGADAVKLQTYTPDGLTLDSARPEFTIAGGPWRGRRLHELYAEAQTPWPWHAELKRIAEARGLLWFSSPFEPRAVEFLETLATPCYKIASFEIVDIGLLRAVGRTGKPVLLSTGMATLAEIDEAVRTLHAAGAGGIVLLKCTSAYPSPAEAMDLRTIGWLADAFGLPVGLSDHSLEPAVPVAAAALGAAVIEKHLTLRRADGGPDAAFSLEPNEFRAMAAAVRAAGRALGRVRLGPTAAEADSRRFRRSLFVVKAVRAGEVFTPDNVRSIRPADGLHPRHLEEVLGRPAARDCSAGTPLSWGDVGAADRVTPA